jgi:hypothetical protein
LGYFKGSLNIYFIKNKKTIKKTID